MVLVIAFFLPEYFEEPNMQDLNLKQTYRVLKVQWPILLSLGLTVHFMIILLVIPLFRKIMAAFLTMNRIPYISFTNIGNIFIHKPQFVLESIVLLIIILGLALFQLLFLINGVASFKIDNRLSLPVLFKRTVSNLRQLKAGDWPMLMIYLLLIVPLGSYLFQSELTAKVRLPIFVVNFIFEKPVFGLLLMTLYGLVLYLNVRLIYTLPHFVAAKGSFFQAAIVSFQKTKRKLWSIIWRIILVETIGLLLVLGLTMAIYVGQMGADGMFSDSLARYFAVANTAILSTASKSIDIVANLFLIAMLTLPLLASQVMASNTNKRPPYKWTAAVFFVLLGFQLVYNTLYFKNELFQVPLVISHRGVDNQNGVQNTIPALKKTIKEQPDFVEMDIHETKDHRFVVMHDENLTTLAHLNKVPHELTLKQLQRLKVHENGHMASIASFDDYLKVAQAQHQKLLIEIKTTPYDSKDYVKHFIKKYQVQILKNGHMIHSLDYHVIEKINQLANKNVKISYILPFSLAFPQTPASAYTMEQTTLATNFVSQAHQHKKMVFAWTVNRVEDMNQMMFMNVDGIITDNLSLLKKVRSEQFNHPTYADKMLINVMRSMGSR
jgi:glycerophosphoryl diester phosphodiesterase